VILALAGAVSARDDGPHRPPWIELASASKLPLHAEAVQSQLWATRDEARADALDQAANRVLDFAAESNPRIRDAWTVPTWFVQDHMLREPVFIEEIDWTYGPMYRAHALLELSPSKRDLILSQWHSALVKQRMNQIGGGLGFLLMCVTTLLVYLRLDDATRGYYSRWLATGAVAVVAGSAAALYSWIA
jgi:hypothetical protein